jgi:hypothetical protein
MRTLFVTLATAVAVALPNAALAAFSYTFQIPASATNIIAGSAIQAECTLYPLPNAGGAQLSTGESATVMLVPTGGAWNGTLSVPVSSPTKPGSYKCWLIVVPGLGNSTTLNILNGVPENTSPGWTGTMYTTVNLP